MREKIRESYKNNTSSELHLTHDLNFALHEVKRLANLEVELMNLVIDLRPLKRKQCKIEYLPELLVIKLNY